MEGTDEVLTCFCGDCTHWKVVKANTGFLYLHCISCNREAAIGAIASDLVSQDSRWQPVT